MSSAGNNFYLQFFQSMLFPAGWTALPQHIGEGTPAERLHLGCYSSHIFARSVVIHGTILRRRTPSALLSGTQFSPSRVGAACTVCRPAVVIQHIISRGRSRPDFHGRVVIPHTFCILAPPCPLLLFSTHFMPEKNAVVIGSTILPCGILAFCSFLCCYSAHILQFVEFQQGCYSQHNFQKRTLLRRSGVVIQGTIPKILFQELLFAAHFRKICIFPSPVVTVSTFFSVCRARLLSAAQFRSAGFLLPWLLNAAHFLQSSFSAPVL